jgi:hypothetical protein
MFLVFTQMDKNNNEYAYFGLVRHMNNINKSDSIFFAVLANTSLRHTMSLSVGKSVRCCTSSLGLAAAAVCRCTCSVCTHTALIFSDK